MQRYCALLLMLLSLALVACNSSDADAETAQAGDAARRPEPYPPQYFTAQAREFAQENLITDGHVDLPTRLKVKGFRLEREYLSVTQNVGGNFDYIRAKEGGLDAPFMSIYVPARTQKTTGQAKAVADTLIDMVEKIAEFYPDKFALASSPAEIEANYERGLVSLPMGMENGAPIEEDLSLLTYFYNRGIRYITLTHSKDNKICDSSYDTTRTWNGLSPFGEEVVKEMNRLGIMIDISHVSDEAFYDVMELTQTPVIASHSSCRKYVPGFERNMDDEMIKRLGQNGGVIQINFGSSFIDSAMRVRRGIIQDELRPWAEERGLNRYDSAFIAKREELYQKHGYPYAHVSRVADHIDHVVSLVGVDHVGFGSDFDGVGDSLPIGLRDVSMYPVLIAELMHRGYSQADLKKICHENVFRVWQQVQNFAQQATS